PFSALDATLRWEMEQVVRATIADFSGTTILVTHNRDEVYRLSDKVAVYNRGSLDVVDEKWALFADPKTAVSARLTGCKNLSPAHREGKRIVAERWGISFPARDGADWPWVGIRAHRFRLCEADTPECYPYVVVNRIEDTFSFILQIRLGDDPTAEPLRWEVDKSQRLTIPDTGYVTVPEQEILLLQGEKG
ncbi:MAG: hypothetical protein IJ751_02720, partial [Oscillospiraceae bacterium]|nr:hypothetical protein [Oscillospiraceae bacterium]